MTPVGLSDAEEIAEAFLLYIFNRPGVAGAVIKHLCHSFVHSLIDSASQPFPQDLQITFPLKPKELGS